MRPIIINYLLTTVCLEVDGREEGNHRLRENLDGTVLTCKFYWALFSTVTLTLNLNGFDA